MSVNQASAEINPAPGQFERVAVLRSAHARPDGSTFATSCSFIVSPDGARLLAGRHITKRAASALTRNAEAHANAPAVLSFKPRRRFQSADRRAA